MTDLMLFAVFPYVALALAIVVSFYRYATDRFSYSSLSSQFLENRVLFWGSVPWHYGILFVLTGYRGPFCDRGFAALYPAGAFPVAALRVPMAALPGGHLESAGASRRGKDIIIYESHHRTLTAIGGAASPFVSPAGAWGADGVGRG